MQKAAANARTRAARLGILIVLLGALMFALGALIPAQRAYAEDGDGQLPLTSSMDATLGAQASNVHYVAIFGADTWVNPDGSFHSPASDLTLVARIDTSAGTVSLLTIPRDLRYDNMTKLLPGAVNLKTNMAFRTRFEQVYDAAKDNYDAAIKAAAKTECKAVSDITGIKITDYVVIDQYQYNTVMNMIGGVIVDIPVGIKDYTLYSDGSLHSINDGETGPFLLTGGADAIDSDAVTAARARVPYDAAHGYKFKKLSDYTGDYPELLIRRAGYNYWRFDGDAVRQFLNRRTLAALIDKGLSVSEGAASLVWDQMVAQKLIWTNLTKKEVTSWANALAKAKAANKLVIHGASIVDPSDGKNEYINDVEQFLIPFDSAYIKAVVKQFKAGEAMTAGWGDETIIGIAKGDTEKVGGITYRALSNSTVSVKAIPNKKKVTIPATVAINGKKYNVTTIAANSMKGSKVRTVILGANVSKISANAFNASKATQITLKTTKLTKAKVKNCLKGSSTAQMKIKVSVKGTAAAKKKVLANYKKYFTKANTGAKKKPLVSF